MSPSSILKELMHGSPEERKDTINRLKKTGNKEVSEVIEKLIYSVKHEKEPKNRANAILALGELNDENYQNYHDIIIETITESCEEPHSLVRYAAASALANIGSESCIPALKRLIYDKDKKVSACAEDGLNKIMLTHAYSETLESDDNYSDE
ncbi:MAG: HEAT repeat domain-containing protein, partial [Thermoplasmata archaeon]